MLLLMVFMAAVPCLLSRVDPAERWVCDLEERLRTGHPFVALKLETVLSDKSSNRVDRRHKNALFPLGVLKPANKLKIFN
jgi:hypothetical protein